MSIYIHIIIHWPPSKSIPTQTIQYPIKIAIHINTTVTFATLGDGSLYVVANPGPDLDYETGPRTFTVNVTATSGPFTITESVIIVVNDTNDLPQFVHLNYPTVSIK